MMRHVVGDCGEIFDIFSRIPKKVMILTGLKTVFSKFIQAAVQHKKECQQQQRLNIHTLLTKATR